MKYKTFALLLILCNASHTIASGLEVTVESKNINCAPILDVSVTNSSDKTISFITNSLPWQMNIFGMSLLLQSTSLTHKIHEPIGFLTDSPSITSLQPGQVIKGSIKLSERFNQLRDILLKGDHILFWQHKITDIKTDKTYISHGSLGIDKCK